MDQVDVQQGQGTGCTGWGTRPSCLETSMDVGDETVVHLTSCTYHSHPKSLELFKEPHSSYSIIQFYSANSILGLNIRACCAMCTMRPPPPLGNRLKSIDEDPLDAIGLPSRGDAKLASSEAQEYYFELLKSRCEAEGFSVGSIQVRQCAGRSGSCLAKQFSNLDLFDRNRRNNQQLAKLLSAMRKLRESLVATKRCDELTREAYLLIIRLTIYLEHHEAYHPALLYVLHSPGLAGLFTRGENMELARYSVLDLAGRQEAMREAWDQAWRCGILHPRPFGDLEDVSRLRADGRGDISNQTLKCVLRAAVRNDLLLFHTQKQKLSLNERILLKPLQRRLDADAVACLSRAYFGAKVDFVERTFNLRWSNESEKVNRGIAEATKSWQKEGENLVFRVPQARKTK